MSGTIIAHHVHSPYAHIRAKGFKYPVFNEEEYKRLLKNWSFFIFLGLNWVFLRNYENNFDTLFEYKNLVRMFVPLSFLFTCSFLIRVFQGFLYALFLNFISIKEILIEPWIYAAKKTNQSMDKCFSGKVTSYLEIVPIMTGVYLDSRLYPCYGGTSASHTFYIRGKKKNTYDVMEGLSDYVSLVK